MEEYRNPVHAVEPFEESQGREDGPVASEDVLAAFYKDMERKETVERKSSKKLTSIWSRKSVKRSATAHPAPRPAQVSHQRHQSHDEKRREEEESVAISHSDSDKPDWVLPMNSPRCIIPDSRDLPASHSKDVWSSVPIPSHKTRYFIHNPVGPRWYKNHHLIPRSETTPAARPPSFFSSSFPPIAASTSQDRLEDPTHVAGPSRTPSNSPLPTPNSSQTRVEDRPRTRKLSETAHDVVDLLDVTDPWGTNWHHHSPYDIGLVNGSIPADVQDKLQTRSRRSSMDQSRGKTVAPSPLSQSMSAINLHAKPEIHIPRKLSKRRAPTPVSATTGSQDAGRHVVSLPTTLDTRLTPSDLPKRMSVAAPLTGSSMSTQNTSKKRGGVLGRLVRKLSLLTKPLSDPVQPKRDDDRQQLHSLHYVSDTAPRHSFEPLRQIPPEKPMSETGKRVPPPPVKEPVNVDDTTKDIDSSSVVSFEAPFSIGRLTIANPDSPELEDTTPAQGAVPLPPNKEPLGIALQDESAPHPTFLPTPQSDPNPPVPPEKTLPPPIPPTKSNDEAVSEIPSTTIPETPSTTIPQSFSEHQRPNLSSQRLELSERPLSNLSNESPVVQGSDSATEQSASSARSNAPSPQKQPQPIDQPSSQPSRVLQPACSTSKKAKSISMASTVPFPTENPGKGLQSFYEYDTSPLSAASVLANPPTPHTNPDKAILATPNQPQPPLPSKISTDVPTRQTETFRLVRSPSNVFSNEKFVAAGEQWEVVGTEKKGIGSSSPKEQTAKEAELKSQGRHHRDRDAKDRRGKEHEPRDRDYKRGTKVRDSRDGDYVRESRNRDYYRDSRDREHARDSKDRGLKRDSRDKDSSRDYRDKEHRESRYRDYHDSRDRDYRRKSRDQDYGRDSRDRYYGHDSRDRDHVRHSRDRDHARELRDHDRDYVHDHKIRVSKDRSHKDRVSTAQLEKKCDSKVPVEPKAEADSRRRHRSRRSSKLGEGERSTTVSKSTPSPVLGSDGRHSEPSTVQHDSKRSDHPQEDRERRTTRKRHEALPATTNPDTAQTLPLPPTQDILTSRPLGRHPSLSARPISQLPPADEINAMRAKEAWDMERLWKARSVQDDELNGYMTIPSNHNTPVMTSISPPVTTSLHGSSHTSFVQQKPQHSLYHSMPAAPPPIVYSSPLSIPTVAHQIPTTSRRQPRTRIYDESVTSDKKSYTSARISNPLPELPRESPYEIPADARNSEYWTKYAGLATTH